MEVIQRFFRFLGFGQKKQICYTQCGHFNYLLQEIKRYKNERKVPKSVILSLKEEHFKNVTNTPYREVITEVVSYLSDDLSLISFNNKTKYNYQLIQGLQKIITILDYIEVLEYQEYSSSNVREKKMYRKIIKKTVGQLVLELVPSVEKTNKIRIFIDRLPLLTDYKSQKNKLLINYLDIYTSRY